LLEAVLIVDTTAVKVMASALAQLDADFVCVIALILEIALADAAHVSFTQRRHLYMKDNNIYIKSMTTNSMSKQRGVQREIGAKGMSKR
jgi:hypothetical protein